MTQSRVSFNKIYLLGSYKTQLAAALNEPCEIKKSFDSFIKITNNAIYSFFLCLDDENQQKDFPRLDFLLFCVANENEALKLLELSQSFQYSDTTQTPKIIIIKNPDIIFENKEMHNYFYIINLDLLQDSFNIKYIFMNKINSIITGQHNNADYFNNRKKIIKENEVKRSENSWLWAQPHDEKITPEKTMIPFINLDFRYNTGLWNNSFQESKNGNSNSVELFIENLSRKKAGK